MNKRQKVFVGTIFMLVVVLLLLLPEIYLYPAYVLVIKPAGESNIEAISSQIIQVDNKSEKCQKIAEWEVKDFEGTYKKRPNLQLDFLGRYLLYRDSVGRIRIRASYFSDDPCWIGYFKVGACGELANLFCEVANRCELETRKVGTQGEDHIWNEVKVDYEWKHVDPTIYYHNYHENHTEKWFDNPGYYEENWFNISKVFVEETREDLTRKYTDVGILNVSLIGKADRISVTTLKNGEIRLVCSEELNTSNLKIELGGKNYTVRGVGELIPFLICRQDVKEVKVMEGEETSVELTPKKLAFYKFYPYF